MFTPNVNRDGQSKGRELPESYTSGQERARQGCYRFLKTKCYTECVLSDSHVSCEGTGQLFTNRADEDRQTNRIGKQRGGKKTAMISLIRMIMKQTKKMKILMGFSRLSNQFSPKKHGFCSDKIIIRHAKQKKQQTR